MSLLCSCYSIVGVCLHLSARGCRDEPVYLRGFTTFPIKQFTEKPSFGARGGAVLIENTKNNYSQKSRYIFLSSFWDWGYQFQVRLVKRLIFDLVLPSNYHARPSSALDFGVFVGCLIISVVTPESQLEVNIKARFLSLRSFIFWTAIVFQFSGPRSLII